MDITAKCTLDYKSTKASFYALAYRGKDPRKDFVGFNIGCAVMALIAYIVMLVFDLSDAGFIYLVVFLIAVVMYWLIYFGMPKLYFRALGERKNIVNEYVFCDDHMKVYSKYEGYKGEEEIGYSYIFRVVENSKYLFIFKSKDSIYTVNKSSIADGSIEDLREKLKPFVKDKYVVCKY